MGDVEMETKIETLEFEDIPHDDVSLDIGKESGDQDSLLGGNKESNQGPTKTHSWYTLGYYQGYFDVSTSQMIGRVRRALIPIGTFYTPDDPKPDMYGPFWIATTLIVLIAATGNFAEYLGADNRAEWKLDFEKLTFAASLFYSMISVVPFIVWFTLKRFGMQQQLVDIISLFGYSNVAYVPTALLCVFPVNFVRLLLVFACFLLSTYFLLNNLRHYTLKMCEDSTDVKRKVYIVLGVVGAIEAALAILVKVYFFSYITFEIEGIEMTEGN